MFILIERFLKELDDCQKLMIYGAGYYATQLYNNLCVCGLKNHICNFMVTKNLDNLCNIDDIPVMEIKDIDRIQEEVFLIVAVNAQYEAEIASEICGYVFQKIIYLSDYIVTDEIKRELYAGLSFDVLSNYAVDEYISLYPNQFVQRQELIDEISLMVQRRNSLEVTNKQIIYILGIVSARAYKIIRSLKNNGYDVVILQYIYSQGYVSEQELEKLSIKKEVFSCIGEMILKALQYNPMLYLIDPPDYSSFFSSILIRHKRIFGKVVFAPYEIWTNCYVLVPPNYYLDERYCLENADGIVWRYFSKENLEQKEGYIFQGKSIQFLDGCNGYTLNHRPQEETNNKLKICSVMAGPVKPYLDEKECSYVRLSSVRDILKKINNTCIYHIYVWDANDIQKEQFEEMKKEYPEFNVFYRINHEELVQQIAQYDYGAEIYTSKDIPTYPMKGDVVGEEFACTEGAYRYSVSNRYFDYLDAEIPIITTLPEKLCEYLGQYDVIIRMDNTTLNMEYLKNKKDYYKERAKIAKQELIVERQIHKLIDFFENL